MSKTPHEAIKAKFFRDMQSLAPADVIITSCPSHGRSAILVLARRGNWLDLSTDAPVGHISLAIDPKGPWRWDRDRMGLFNEQSDRRRHIGPGIEVQKLAGVEELGWYQTLPRPGQVRWHVSPDNLIGTAGDPATVAKLHALASRMQSASDADQTIQAMVQIVELAFAGAEHLLDKRRVHMLVASMNAMAGIGAEGAKQQQSRRNPTDELDELASLFGAMMRGEGRSGRGPLGDLFAEMELGRDSATGGRRKPSDSSPRARGNGHAGGG